VLPCGTPVFVVQVFLVVGNSVQLGGDGDVGTSKQDRRGGQRFIGSASTRRCGSVLVIGINGIAG